MTFKLNSKNYLKLFWLYFAFSLVVVCLNIFFIFVFGTGVVKISLVSHAPLQWYEYIAMVCSDLLIPSIFGLFALLAKKRASKKAGVGWTFFSWAAAIGLAMSLLSYILDQLSHIDCGNSCVSYIPSYTAINWMFAVNLFLSVVCPLVLAVKSNRR